MTESPIIALSREQGDAAARQVWEALRGAGPDGLTPGEACARSGLPERRYRRAVDRLVAEGRVRRDGRTRLYAIVDDSGLPVPVHDAEGRRRAAEAAERQTEAWRGQFLGGITDGLDLLDGRRMPAGMRAEAEGARRYLRALTRHVRDAPTAEELEYLAREAGPVIAGMNTLIQRAEAERAAVTARRESAAREIAELREYRRRMLAEYRRAANLADRLQDLGDYVTPESLWQRLTTVEFLGNPAIVWEMESAPEPQTDSRVMRFLGALSDEMAARNAGYQDRTAIIASTRNANLRHRVKVRVYLAGRQEFRVPASAALPYVDALISVYVDAVAQVDARIQRLRTGTALGGPVRAIAAAPGA